MKIFLKYRRIYLLSLLPISLILIILAKNCSFFAENVFALHFYKWISQLISSITGILPFSIGEILVILVPIAILVILFRFFFLLVMEKQGRKERLIRGLLNLTCTVSVVMFLFTAMAGINYYRYSFSYYSGLEIHDSSVKELYELTKSLVVQADQLRAQIKSTDENGVFKLAENKYKLADMAKEAFDSLSKHYKVLGGSYGAPKPVFFSELMSNTEITGIFFPFTMEANVNVDIPDYSIPSTMLHEMAHQRGFMREDEANFIAYMAGMNSDSVELQYSSTMLALITAGNALYDQDYSLYTEIRDMYSEGVRRDLQANSAYWQKYDNTVVSTVSDKINDTYLKANSQTDGVKSYGRMLDLLLAEYRSNNKSKK